MISYRIGIDPGVSGALALLEYKGEWPELINLIDMPVLALSGNKKQVNASELGKVLRAWSHDIEVRTTYPKNTIIVYLEQVASMPGQGVAGMFNFGMSYGMVQGVVACLGYPMVLVRPTAWKKRAGLMKTNKDQARTYAQQLFPAADLKLKKYIGRADAILIAMFGG